MKIEIGTKLWNGGYPMMTYEVTAVIKRDKNTQYEILCKSCNHSNQCILLITKNDHKKLVYVGMVNENDEDDFSDKHYYFHKDNGNFHLTKEEAEIEKVTKRIDRCDEEIRKHEDGIKYQAKRKEEYQDRLNSYKEVVALMQEAVKK